MSYYFEDSYALEWFGYLADVVNQPTLAKRKTGLASLHRWINSDPDLSAEGVLFDTSLYPRLPRQAIFDGPKIARLIKDGSVIKNVIPHLKERYLTQLLYAVVWKNGDRKKLRSLRQGLVGDSVDNVENGSYVFYQFGKHLIDRNQPIVDQHTGRAYAFYRDVYCNRNEYSSKVAEKVRRRKKLAKTDYSDYLKWIDSTVLPTTKRRVAALSHLDQIMFTFGKMLTIKL
jgi:hypothetical protein